MTLNSNPAAVDGTTKGSAIDRGQSEKLRIIGSHVAALSTLLNTLVRAEKRLLLLFAEVESFSIGALSAMKLINFNLSNVSLYRTIIHLVSV